MTARRARAAPGAQTPGSGASEALTEEDFERLAALHVRAMGQRLRETCEDEAYDSWTLEEKAKEMIDAEAPARQGRKVAKLARDARLKDPAACVEDVTYMPERKLSKDRANRLAECGWVESDEVLVVISKTGAGKSFLSQALGNAACRRPMPTRYLRLADMCAELNRARPADDGSYHDVMDRLKGVKPLIIDDFLTTPIETVNTVDLLEALEAREGRRATLIASQLEPNEWYLRLEGEIIADSILGRVASPAATSTSTGRTCASGSPRTGRGRSSHRYHLGRNRGTAPTGFAVPRHATAQDGRGRVRLRPWR